MPVDARKMLSYFNSLIVLKHRHRKSSGRRATAGPIIWSEAKAHPQFISGKILMHAPRSPASCTTLKRARSTPLISELESSVEAQEQANSIAEGSAAAQQGPQGPHLPQNLSFRRKGETRSIRKVWFEQWLCHGSTTMRLQVLFSFLQLQGRQE